MSTFGTPSPKSLLQEPGAWPPPHAIADRRGGLRAHSPRYEDGR